jgi:hypothetical protein
MLPMNNYEEFISGLKAKAWRASRGITIVFFEDRVISGMP